MEFKVREAQPIAMKIGFYEDFLNLRTIIKHKILWSGQPSHKAVAVWVVFTVKTELKNN